MAPMFRGLHVTVDAQHSAPADRSATVFAEEGDPAFAYMGNSVTPLVLAYCLSISAVHPLYKTVDSNCLETIKLLPMP